MVEQTKKDLNKFTGELISSFIDFDKQDVIDFQAGLLSIHNKEQNLENKTNLYSIRTKEDLKDKQAELGIKTEDVKKAKISVLSGKGMPREVPVAGMISVTLGLVSNETKDTLMEAQAGNRIIKAVEDIQAANQIVDKEKFINGTIVDVRDSSKQARFFIGGFGKDPEYLASAQANNHLADILAGSLALDKDNKKIPEVKEAMESLKNTGAKILGSAAMKLSKQGHDNASSKIEKLANSFDTKEKNRDVVVKAISMVSGKLEEKGIISSKEKALISDLVKVRAGQTKTIDRSKLISNVLGKQR
jgi:hypothetical protein